MITRILPCFSTTPPVLSIVKIFSLSTPLVPFLLLLLLLLLFFFFFFFWGGGVIPTLNDHGLLSLMKAVSLAVWKRMQNGYLWARSLIAVVAFLALTLLHKSVMLCLWATLSDTTVLNQVLPIFVFSICVLGEHILVRMLKDKQLTDMQVSSG